MKESLMIELPFSCIHITMSVYILLCLYVSGTQVWYLTPVLENFPLFSLKLMWVCVCVPL